MIREIHPNAASLFQTVQEGTGCPVEYYHSLSLDLLDGGSRKLYVGDVVCVACPRDDEDILVPPSSPETNNNNNTEECWYPFREPWKVGMILALWSTTTPEGEWFDMALQWLHRDLHLPAELGYKSVLHKRFRPEHRYGMLLESKDIQIKMSVHKILPQAFVRLSEQTIHQDDMVETSSSANNNGPLQLLFSISHALTDPSMTGIERITGWQSVNDPKQSATLGASLTESALMRAWNLLEQQQTSLDQSFWEASKRSYEEEAPLKLQDRQRRQDEWDHQKRVAEELERMEQQQQRAKAKAKQAARTRKASAPKQNQKQTQTAKAVPKSNPKKKKATVVKRKTAVKVPKPNVKPKTKAKPGPKQKSASKVVSKKKLPKSKPAAKKTKSMIDNNDNDNDEEWAKPMGRAIQTGTVMHYTSVQVPCRPQQWHTSRRAAAATTENSWTFHVGDVLAVTSNKCTPPPHLSKQQQQWYPYRVDWCPALVLDIYQTGAMKNNSGNKSGDSSRYTMKIRWLVRWGDLKGKLQKRLEEVEDGRVATELQTVPHMVLESNLVDVFPVTAALGKLAIRMGKDDDDDDMEDVELDKSIPPSVTLQCHYKIRMDQPSLLVGKKGTIDKFMTAVTDWGDHYQKVTKGGFQAWRRLVEEENDNTADDQAKIPLEPYWKFLSKGKTITGWTHQKSTSTAPARTTARTTAMAKAKKRTKPKPAVAPKFMTDFQQDLPSVSSPMISDDRSEIDSPANVSQATDSTAAEDRILAQFQKPIHKDKSSGRIYYDRIQIQQPFDAYAITTTARGSSSVDSQQPQSWELKVGDMVSARYEDHYKASGASFFEPDAITFPIASRENSKHYPFLAAWGGT